MILAYWIGAETTSGGAAARKSRSPDWSAADVARMGMLLALATCLHVFEAQLPALPFPGAKLGLANLVSVFALYVWGWRKSLLLSIMRQVIGSTVTGTFLAPASAFGLAGGVLSVLTMAAAMAISGRRIGVVAVSLMGAASHNVGQLLVAWMLLGHVQVFFYLPYLLWFAIPSGAFVGALASRLLQRETQEPKETLRRRTIRERLFAGAAAAALAAAGIWAAIEPHAPMAPHAHAHVRIAGQEAASIPLDGEGVYDLHGDGWHMRLAIEEGRIRVERSTCRHQFCVRTGWIHRPDQSIVCLPYQVVITLIGGDDGGQPDYDALIG